MLDVNAIARCSRCNVISLPLRVIKSDPTHVGVSIPDDWTAVRWYADGEEEFILCPSCNREAYDWLQDTVARRSTREEEKTVLDALEDILYPMDELRDHQWNGGDVCEAVAALIREHRPTAHLRQRVSWPLDFVKGHGEFSAVESCDGMHHWHDSFVSTTERVAVHNETYCRQCGATYRSLKQAGLA